jgi:hypothetical protein
MRSIPVSTLVSSRILRSMRSRQNLAATSQCLTTKASRSGKRAGTGFSPTSSQLKHVGIVQVLQDGSALTLENGPKSITITISLLSRTDDGISAAGLRRLLHTTNTQCLRVKVYNLDVRDGLMPVCNCVLFYAYHPRYGSE